MILAGACVCLSKFFSSECNTTALYWAVALCIKVFITVADTHKNSVSIGHVMTNKKLLLFAPGFCAA
jgi:hypothetical protein